MKIEKNTLEEREKIAIEIGHFLGAKEYLCTGKIGKRLEDVYKLSNDNSMDIFTEFCMYMADRYLTNSYYRIAGLTNYITIYVCKFLEEFVNERMNPTMEEKLMLAGEKIKTLLYTFLTVGDLCKQDKKTILVSILEEEFRPFATNGYLEKIDNIAETLISDYYNKKEDGYIMEATSEILRSMLREYFLDENNEMEVK